MIAHLKAAAVLLGFITEFCGVMFLIIRWPIQSITTFWGVMAFLIFAWAYSELVKEFKKK